MTDVETDHGADSTPPPWAVTRVDFWSLAVVIVVVVVALGAGAIASDGNRLAQAARAAVQGQVGIMSTHNFEPVAAGQPERLER